MKEKIKKYFSFIKERKVFIIFSYIFFTLGLVSGYWVSPLFNNVENKVWGVLVLLAAIIFMLLGIYFIGKEKIKNEMNNNQKHMYYGTLIGFLAFDGLIITVIFRIISLFDDMFTFRYVGFASLVVIMISLIIITGAIFLPVEKWLAFLYKKEEKK